MPNFNRFHHDLYSVTSSFAHFKCDFRNWFIFRKHKINKDIVFTFKKSEIITNYENEIRFKTNSVSSNLETLKVD